ncbi:MAG: cell division protein FtsA [Bacilli bacterium]|nr:cell division protein FtsA [Bacilli bacterium]MDD4053552.1 cell division protein FtsA [Bacilli bacterium]
MKRIYTCIDIGSSSIKVLVGEMFKGRLIVLATSCVKSRGVKKGLIIDANEAISSIKEAIAEVEGKLGIKIDKVIASVPAYLATYTEVDGYSTITSEDKKVTGNDITRALQACVYNKISEDVELVTIIPIEFVLDKKANIKDPKGMVGSKLGIRAMMVTTSKKSLYAIVSILESLGLKVVETNFGTIGEYYEYRDKDMDKMSGAIISIGGDLTNVTIFDKGIATASDIIPLGGHNIDNDIAYIKKISKTDALRLKESFAIANRHYAQGSETISVFDKFKKEISLNQLEISDIVMSRLLEILKLAKKQASLLTNKENSYIIITGGVSEMPGMTSLLGDVFGKEARIGNIETMGIRDNKYAALAGMIKYFHGKLNLRGKEYSMLSVENEEELISSKKGVLNISEDSVLGKVFGYFFDK